MHQSNENIEILPMTFFVNPLQEIPQLSYYSIPSPQSFECQPQISNKFRFMNHQNKPRSISFEVKPSIIRNQKEKFLQLQQKLQAKDSQIQKLKQQVAFLRNQSTMKQKQRIPSKHPLQIGDFNNLNLNQN